MKVKEFENILKSYMKEEASEFDANEFLKEFRKKKKKRPVILILLSGIILFTVGFFFWHNHDLLNESFEKRNTNVSQKISEIKNKPTNSIQTTDKKDTHNHDEHAVNDYQKDFQISKIHIQKMKESGFNNDIVKNPEIEKSGTEIAVPLVKDLNTLSNLFETEEHAEPGETTAANHLDKSNTDFGVSTFIYQDPALKNTITIDQLKKIMPKEIFSQAKDVIHLDVQSPQNIIKQGKKMDVLNLELNIHNLFGHKQIGNISLDEYVAYRLKNENYRAMVSGNFLIKYKPYHSFFVKSGFSFHSIIEKLNHKYNKEILDTIQSVVSVMVNSNRDTINVIKEDIPGKRIISGYDNRHYNINVIEVPVFLGKSFHLKHFTFDVELGFYCHIFSKATGFVMDRNYEYITPKNSVLPWLKLNPYVGLKITHPFLGNKFYFDFTARKMSDVVLIGSTKQSYQLYGMGIGYLIKI